MSLCPALSGRSSHHAALSVPCSYPRSRAAAHRQRRQCLRPPSTYLSLRRCPPPMPRRRRAAVPAALPWRRPRRIPSRSLPTRIHRTMRSPTASTSSKINHRMSTFRLPSTIPIARRPRRPSSIWAPLWLWALSVASFSWPPSSQRS